MLQNWLTILLLWRTILKKLKTILLLADWLNERTRGTAKGKEVNIALKRKCAENDFLYCDNSNLLSNYHVNSSGVHLNENGTVSLANNFLAFLNL